jgi:hypothetical protein
MEASEALYAFAEVKRKILSVIAHLTNTMAQIEGDFEKGRRFWRGRDSLKTIVLSALKRFGIHGYSN